MEVLIGDIHVVHMAMAMSVAGDLTISAVHGVNLSSNIEWLVNWFACLGSSPACLLSKKNSRGHRNESA